MPLPIVHFNDPILRKKGVAVARFDGGLRKLAADMIDTMHEAHGIGLAAQQIGQALRLCVIDLREADADFDWELDGSRPPLDLFMPMVLANPEVKAEPGDETSYEEGCLSFPAIRGDIVRPDEITVKYKDEHGTPHTLRCNGLFARCVQHEVDHLDGVLFIDHMDKKTLAALEPQLKELRKRTKEKLAK
jgi:peptide deformylase